MNVINEEDVKTLTQLGLTRGQARIYLSLVHSGTATIKTIAQISKVPRQDTYRIISSLQKLGLVEKIIASPNRFKATHIRDSASILQKRNAEEYRKNQRYIKELLQRHNRNNEKAEPQEDDPQVTLIAEKSIYILRATKTMNATQTCINCTTTGKTFLKVFSTFEEAIKKALKRNVEIKWITEKTYINSLPENMDALTKNSHFKLKVTSNPIKLKIGLYDKKEIFIAALTNSGACEPPIYWTNNPYLASAMLEYFEMLWNTATEYNPKKPSKPFCSL